MILRHTHGGQQAAVNVDIPASDFRRQPRRVQIEKDALGTRDAPGSILHAVLEIDGHPRRIAVGVCVNHPHPRNLPRSRPANGLAPGVHRRIRAHFFRGWRSRC